ncbi:transcription factor bHLH137-like [Chenopodium quinoa]|uniref:BHLH domain-containing protein n=1 Tax=Chenopodium quinoa TaxID=63459 RepID=A0A803L1G1_CHEQI|nr:transcription factor bHLH137-like [Chenopodium quinoa]
MSATWYQQPSSFLCVVDDGQQHPHFQSTHHPASNYDTGGSSCTSNLTAMPHNINHNYSWICDNFSTFEDFSQYYDSHQQYYQGTDVNELTAVPENTKSSTIHPEGTRQNTKGRQRSRRTDKKKDNVLEKKNNTTQNICKKGEEKTICDNKEDASGCKDGCVYVRAKRGQAIGSHSLAERVRRQKISEKMKLLQSIVPGCDKIAGKIPTLDNIIDYIHTLQDQVKSLMTEIALVDPTFDVNYLALESIVTHLESSYATTDVSECSRIASQYQSIPLYGSSAQAVSALPSPWLALLEDREYTI